MAIVKRLIKTVLPGVSWQNPVVKGAFRILDPLDYVFRVSRGLTDLPQYSVRVRSNGVDGQFGGDKFTDDGNRIVEALREGAGLTAASQVLEIGCGCGRSALALTKILDGGTYVGMDIEKISLDACMKNRALVRPDYRFDLLDVQNAEYNPTGQHRASQYRFPYEDASFDVIFLISVFTHMMTEDVENYLAEIGRMLKPGGRCMVSTFLVDFGRRSESGFALPHRVGEAYFYDRKLPEVAVGYELSFFEAQARKNGMQVLGHRLGGWRRRRVPEHRFGQDLVFLARLS